MKKNDTQIFSPTNKPLALAKDTCWNLIFVFSCCFSAESIVVTSNEANTIDVVKQPTDCVDVWKLVKQVSQHSEQKMGNQIRSAWEQVQAAREAKYESPNKMFPPATEEMIDQLAKELGLEIPEQLRESLLIHNGMEEWGLEIIADEDTGQTFTFLSIERIREHWNADRHSEAEAVAEGDAFPKKSEWIPVFVEPAEKDDEIYVDSSDGTVLLYSRPSSVEVNAFRYPDLLSFLRVIEHHIRNDLWFTWGNDLETKAIVPPLMLDESGITKLISEMKTSARVKVGGDAWIEVDQDPQTFLNSILDSFKPVKFVRSPGVQNPEFVIEFVVGSETQRIAVKRGPEEHLSYSIGNMQFTGGDPEKFQKLIESRLK